MFERWLAPRRGQPPAASPPGPPGVPDRRMAEAVALWSDLYRGKPPWKPRDGGLGLAAAIASELARQTTLELQSRILGSRRAEFLDRQYRRVLDRLRPALEVGCATGALALSLGIAIQNFPEGAIISMPLRAEGMSKSKAFLCGTLSGIVEPIGALLTILAAQHIIAFLPYFLSFAAGAMLYVVVEELIPEMSQGRHSNLGTLFFAIGFTLMMALDVGLG